VAGRFLHHENTPAHTAHSFQKFLIKNNTPVSLQPSYSPDHWTFPVPKIEVSVKGHQFVINRRNTTETTNQNFFRTTYIVLGKMEI